MKGIDRTKWKSRYESRFPLDSIWGSVTGWPWTRGRPTSTSRNHEYTVAKSTLKSQVFRSTRLLDHDSPLFDLFAVVASTAYHSTKQTLHYVESVTLDVYDWCFISALLSSIIQRAWREKKCGLLIWHCSYFLTAKINITMAEMWSCAAIKGSISFIADECIAIRKVQIVQRV